MNLESQIPIYNNASSNNCNFDNEKIHCTPTSSMIYKFLDVPKTMDYEKLYIPLPQVKTFTL
jgi:hypothetical protein